MARPEGLPTGPVWLIGAGNMAGAMLFRWLESGLDPRAVTVIRRTPKPIWPGVTVLAAPPPDGAAPAVAMLGVKPQMLDDVAPWLAPLLAPETLLVSILAGVEIASLRRRFARPRAIVRAMPNTPVALGQGVTALFGDGLDEAHRAMLERLMEALGLVEWVADEAALDLVAALAGSGPAFLFRFIDALAAAGEAMGLTRDDAAAVAKVTVSGAAAMAAASDRSPSALAEAVASTGGMTREGLNVLDDQGALNALLTRTLEAAIHRGREMAAERRRN
jgi:pyrroline-5-carboxylate reductase